MIGPTPAPEPLFTVLRGELTDVEVAALTAVLAALARPGPGAAAPEVAATPWMRFVSPLSWRQPRGW